MWPIQLAFHFLISCRIFLCSLTLSNTSSFLAWSVQLIFSILLQHHISKLSRYFVFTLMTKNYKFGKWSCLSSEMKCHWTPCLPKASHGCEMGCLFRSVLFGRFVRLVELESHTQCLPSMAHLTTTASSFLCTGDRNYGQISFQANASLHATINHD